MVFKKIRSSAPVAEYLVELIKNKLKAGEKVLWLVPGGSSLPIAVAVANKLNKSNMANLTVSLTDERYGPIGHNNSNWAQLEKTGFSLPGADLEPVLVNRPLEETVRIFDKKLSGWLDSSAFKLAFCGIGADHHTFGIKPKSPAVFSNQLVSGYRAEDFTRITLTPTAIARLDEIVIYAVGEEKRPALDALGEEASMVLQPAQALKQVPALTIYNDYKGEPT